MKKRLKVVVGKPAGLLTCPECGNDRDFVELARNVTVTTRYVQNRDGSFSPLDNETDAHGPVQLICGRCGEDLSRFHHYFINMLF